jgi:hypothetical protein
MADSTKFPSLYYFNWSTPSAPNPTLSASLSIGDTTAYFSNPPLDGDGNIITGGFLMGVKNAASYVETLYVAPGAVAGDGLSATVVRGIRLEGLDFTTTDSTLEQNFNAGDAIFCNISGCIQALNAAFIQGTIASGGTGLIIGTDASGTVTVSRSTGVGTNKGFVRWNTTSGKTEYSNDGVTWNTFDSVTASNLVLVSVADTTPKVLRDALDNTADISLSITSPGGNEKILIGTTLPDRIDDHTTVTPSDDAGKIPVLAADGYINNTLINPEVPTTTTYDISTYTFGSSTTRFDITNPSGTTARYTWDGTGTDPVINATTVPTGTVLHIKAQNFNANNNIAQAVVTGSGANYFEITNAAVVAENDKTIGTGYIDYFSQKVTWTKPDFMIAGKVETWAAGGGSGANASGPAGGGGAYNSVFLPESAFGATEDMYIGVGGRMGFQGGDTHFGTLVYAYGGGPGNGAATEPGGGGGGIMSAGAAAGTGGNPTPSAAAAAAYAGGGGGSTSTNGVGGSAYYGGGGGAAYGENSGGGGSSIYGGGGGGGVHAGTSTFGGNGGTNNVAGVTPGGGAGTNADDKIGGHGRIKVTIFY